MKTLDSLGKGRQDCLPMNSDGGLDRRTMSLPSLRGGEWERAGFRNSRLPPPQPSAFLSPSSTAIISSPQPSSPWPLSLRPCYCGPLFLSAHGSGSRKPEGCLRIFFLRNSGKLQVIQRPTQERQIHHCANALLCSLPRHPQCRPTSPRPS